jgi:hypothetical protein
MCTNVAIPTHERESNVLHVCITSLLYRNILCCSKPQVLYIGTVVHPSALPLNGPAMDIYLHLVRHAVPYDLYTVLVRACASPHFNVKANLLVTFLCC